jgi:glutathione S-transferase
VALTARAPFAGLTIPPDARVNQIAVLAPKTQGEAGAPALQIWARLGDGTPLVSAAPLGRGWRVLFHTTAGPAWSDVAFSGLQVSMLRRVLARAGSSTIPAKAIAPTAPLRPTLILDGYGNLRAPSAGDLPIAPQNVGNAKPDSRHPPGIYEGGGSRLILQAASPDTTLPALPVLAGIERLNRAQDQATNLGPALLALGLILCALDALLALVFAGKLAFPKSLKLPGRALAALVFTVISVATLVSQDARAQSIDPTTKPAPSDLSLAFIRTGDAATDARAKAGLEGLSRVLAARTSVEPGAVVGVDPSATDLALFPLLYWLLPDRPIETSAETARALDRFMKSGGVIFVDSRGAGREPAAAGAIARAALRGIEAPPLEQVPNGHVLGKSFYILRGFPGRYQNAKLWVETAASAAASANDGVSPLIVGDGDWASAWANAAPSVQYGDYSPAQRAQEIAARVGVNIVLYALTGNYKADQVHFETLLKRLGPR